MHPFGTSFKCAIDCAKAVPSRTSPSILADEAMRQLNKPFRKGNFRVTAASESYIVCTGPYFSGYGKVPVIGKNLHSSNPRAVSTHNHNSQRKIHGDPIARLRMKSFSPTSGSQQDPKHEK
jgi:hypothetical protein